jgi:hypothetical protein
MNAQLSPEAMRLLSVRTNLAALSSGDWTVVHDDKGRLVLEAVGLMDAKPVAICRFSSAVSKDEIAFISSAPDTVRFLLVLLDRAMKRLRDIDPALQGRNRRGDAKGEPQVDPKNYAAEAGMLCSEPAFMVFLAEEHGLERPLTPERAAQKLRSLCGVTSRKQFNDDGQAAEAWRQLRAAYAAWRKAGR